MADPLRELRDCILSNKDIREEEENVFLGENSWPKNTPTSFKSSCRGNQPSVAYTLEALLYFLKNSSLPHAVYYSKAQSQNVQHVKRYDRKALLKYLTGSSFNRTEVTPVEVSKRKPEEYHLTKKRVRYEKEKTQRKTKSNDGAPKEVISIDDPSPPVVSSNATEPSSAEVECVTLEEGPSKASPGSRGCRSSVSSVSTVNEVETIGGSTSTQTQTDPDSQPATIQAYQVIIGRLIKFLQDDLGLSREEQESVLEGKKISLRRVLQRSKNQRCFVAVPHPVHEWDTVKDDGAHVVSGQRINRKADDIEKRYQCVLDNCLKRGEADLKDSLSLLISHMRDLNKSNLTEAEVEVSCKRTLEHCLTSAQEDFREMFESLLSVVDDKSQEMELQRWISESEVELRKLLNSLMLSLQTLRDVSACSRTLFHFPEPIVSIALNPTKVTHSVVLEIYVRLGLAELRRILVHIISSIEKARTNIQGDRKRRQSDSEGVDDPEEVDDAKAKEDGRSGSASCSTDGDPSPDCPSTRLVESIKNEWSVDEGEGSGALNRRKSAEGAPSTVTQSNNTETSAAGDSGSQTAPFWKSADLYSSFKTTIGSTLVTSFKKRIQEKIEASTTTEECITWLRTKKGLLPDLDDV